MCFVNVEMQIRNMLQALLLFMSTSKQRSRLQKSLWIFGGIFQWILSGVFQWTFMFPVAYSKG